ncbi:MAG: aminopeptidase P family protein [Clostridia bacterium]|nr:aminopeptidase P family protein [Clostridia bacterium]
MNPRIKWLRNQLIPLKLDGIIVSNPINIRYLTGLSEEGTLIIAPKENVFITDSRYIESVNHKLTIDDEIIAYDSRNLSKYDYEGFFMLDENVGFEESYLTYEKYKRYLHTYQVNLVETEGLLENQRIVKDEEEFEYTKKACEITDKAFEYIIRNIKKGMTEKEVAFEIERFMISNGADGLAFETIVASGENSSMPHAVPSDRVIQKGDIIQFDFGAKYKGYCADLSRAVFVEEVKEEYKEIYDFVLEEQKRLSNSLKDGANIKTVIKDRETEYKLKNYQVMHAFGHGVGLEIHELPILRSNQDNILKENSIIAIEPGVYFSGKFGIRIEDTFKVTKFGAEAITKCKKDYTIIKLA